jgi:hypothetical protein
MQVTDFVLARLRDWGVHRVYGYLGDGLPDPEAGALRPDPARPGLGVDIRWADLAPYRVHGPARPDRARP